MRKLLIGASFFVGMAVASMIGYAGAQGFVIPGGSQFLGTPQVGGLAPVCTTNCTLKGGSDFVGQAEITTGASNVVITWAAAKNAAPFCVVEDITTAVIIKGVATTTTLTISGSTTSSDFVNWICFNQIGG